MSRDGRLQESRASIVIVPTTTSYELEPCQEQRAPRKRKRCAALSFFAALSDLVMRCWMVMHSGESAVKDKHTARCRRWQK